MHKMKKIIDGTARMRKVAHREWMFEIEPFPRIPQKTFGEALDDLKLQRVLKRACLRELAPQNLIDSIRREIRA